MWGGQLEIHLRATVVNGGNYRGELLRNCCYCYMPIRQASPSPSICVTLPLPLQPLLITVSEDIIPFSLSCRGGGRAKLPTDSWLTGNTGSPESSEVLNTPSGDCHFRSLSPLSLYYIVCSVLFVMCLLVLVLSVSLCPSCSLCSQLFIGL